MVEHRVADPIRLRIVDGDMETRTLIAALLRNHTGREYVVESVPPDNGFGGMSGAPGDLERTAAEALRDSEAQLAAALADRERLERQFYQAQKMETVGQLAGGIAHDFNNILTAIVGFGTLVAEQVSDNEPASRNAAEILAAANRASALTRQLLAFGRRQVLHPTRLNLNDTVNALAVMLRQLIGENIDLHIICARDLPPIRADQSQLESALANLVVNARDAMPRGGRLTIETSEVVLDSDYCTTHVSVRPGRYVRLAVSDTGIGISQDLQTRIFEPFFTTKEAGKGSGLGLATVYGIVKQSGGNIWVYSEPGIGATFKVYLPIDASDRPAAGPSDPARGQWSKGSETVLLVEDAPMIRRLAREVMSRVGYTVLEAADANQALSLVATHAGPIDLLLTDLIMPGPSGVDLAEQLKAIRADVRVLFMSGYTDNAIVRNGLLAEGASFLQKPFTPEELLRKMRQVLDAQPI
jgi:signal transduction histidine kinase/ActR/RegA family two-component response regulator